MMSFRPNDEFPPGRFEERRMGMGVAVFGIEID